jgi:hypothetical protein
MAFDCVDSRSHSRANPSANPFEVAGYTPTFSITLKLENLQKKPKTSLKNG